MRNNSFGMLLSDCSRGFLYSERSSSALMKSTFEDSVCRFSHISESWTRMTRPDGIFRRRTTSKLHIRKSFCHNPFVNVCVRDFVHIMGQECRPAELLEPITGRGAANCCFIVLCGSEVMWWLAERKESGCYSRWKQIVSQV